MAAECPPHLGDDSAVATKTNGARDRGVRDESNKGIYEYAPVDKAGNLRSGKPDALCYTLMPPLGTIERLGEWRRCVAKDCLQVMFVGVEKVHLEAMFPEEDAKEGHCAWLNKSLYKCSNMSALVAASARTPPVAPSAGSDGRTRIRRRSAGSGGVARVGIRGAFTSHDLASVHGAVIVSFSRRRRGGTSAPKMRRRRALASVSCASRAGLGLV